MFFSCFSLEGEQEEVFALREEVQRLRVANAQFHQGGGASSVASSISGPSEVSNTASSNFLNQTTPDLFIFIGRGSVLFFLALHLELIYLFMIGLRMLKHALGVGVLPIERRPSSFMIIWRGKQKKKLDFAF